MKFYVANFISYTDFLDIYTYILGPNSGNFLVVVLFLNLTMVSSISEIMDPWVNVWGHEDVLVESES